mgnify:CR=1 FL=1
MWAAVLTVTCSVLSQAAATGEELRLEVRRLVQQLDAPTLAQREAAEEALTRLGAEILPLLPRGEPRGSAEVRLRLDRVRRVLEQQAGRRAAEASVVTLSADGMELSKVLAELQRQSGNRIVDARRELGQPADDVAIHAKFEKTPFWKALDQVLDEAGLTVYPYAADRAIHLVARPEGQSPRGRAACYSGPFRFEPLRVVAQRNLRDAEGDSLRVAVEVAWEPRLRPIGLDHPMAGLSALDETGAAIAPLDAQAVYEVTARDEASAAELVVPLKLPPRRVERIDRLRGAVGAMLPGAIETFRFDKLVESKNVEQRQAGATVTLVGVRRNNELWQVLIRVRYDDAGDALQSHRGWIFRNEAYLEQPDGTRLAYDALETTSQSRNEVGIAYGFALDAPPDKMAFVYRTPGTIVRARFDYELGRLDLP